MTGLYVLLAVLALSTAFALMHRARTGRVRAVGPPAAGSARGSARAAHAAHADAPADAPGADVLAALGQQPGERATLLQFSSAFCAPCRATRRVLADVAAVVPGVRHVEVDAERHLDLVRRLRVSSTPTTLVLDAAGRVTARAAGQPRKEAVLAALADVVDAPGVP